MPAAFTVPSGKAHWEVMVAQELLKIVFLLLLPICVGFIIPIEKPTDIHY